MSIRKGLRSLLYTMGLGKPVAFLRRCAYGVQDYLLSMRYPNTEHEIILGSKTIRLAVEDAYTRGWLYPRYAQGRLHEPPVTQLFAQKAANAKHIADVGANLGWFTCIAAVFQPEGKVTAFELDSGFAALVRRNLAKNKAHKADVVNAAVGATPGEITYVRPTTAHPGLSLRGEKFGQTVTAQLVSLDEWYADKPAPDLVKIDVEGAEMDVLRGMTRILEETRPLLFIELHPKKLPEFGESIDDVLAFIRDRGYTLYEMQDWREGADVKLEPLIGTPTTNDMLFAEPS